MRLLPHFYYLLLNLRYLSSGAITFCPGTIVRHCLQAQNQKYVLGDFSHKCLWRGFHNPFAIFLSGSTCFFRFATANQLRVTNPGGVSNRKERNMKTSHTLCRSRLELEYPIHIQQAIILISAVLRRIAAKHSPDSGISDLRMQHIRSFSQIGEEPPKSYKFRHLKFDSRKRE